MRSPARPDPPRRRRWWVGAAALAAVAAAHTGTWWLATTRIEQGVPDFVAEAARDGWRVESSEPVRAGWPFTATIRLPAFSATRVLGATTLRWSAERLDVSIGPVHPTMLELAPGGAQSIGVSQSSPGGEAVLAFRADRMVALVPLAGGPIDLVAAGVDAGTASGRVRVATLTGSLDLQHLAMQAGGIALLPALAAPFDGPIDLTASATASIALPASGNPGQSAAAWHEAGGRVELTALRVHWGRLVAEGNGTGGLDGQLQPEGRASLRVQGAIEALDAMAQGGMVAPGPASAARAVLGLLVLAARGGPVSVPIAVQDRVLTVTQFPVLRLPLLDWNLP